VRLFQPCVAAAALPPVRFEVGCAALTWVGARPSSYVGACFLPGAAAAALAAGALWGWLCRLSLGWVHGRRLARVRLSCQVQLRRLCRRCAFGLAVPLGFGWVHGLRLALARISCRVLLRRIWPPVRFEVGCALWVLAGCMACVLRWRVCPAGCSCHALPPVRFWSVLRLSLRGVLHTWEKHYPWVYRGCVNYRCTPFPLINNRPLSEGAAVASRLGEGRYIEKPSGPADAQPVLRECSLWQLWLPG